MIFAAGLGTRLKPLTDNTPKALITINGKPLLQIVIEKLIYYGFDEIIINVHHFPDQIIDFLNKNNNFKIRIEISDERNELLDTGGGILNAKWFFDDGKPFLVHNVDILSNIDLKALYNQHIISNSAATLVVSERNTFRYLLFDNTLQLKAWVNEKTGETKPTKFEKIESYKKLAFSGIQVLSPAIFEKMQNNESKFSIMDFYLSTANSQRISAFIPQNYRMMDVGKLEMLDDAELFIKALSSELH